MKKTKTLYHGHRFPAVVISCAVRWYFRFSLSLRDVEELLLERGVVVTYAPQEVPKGRNDPLPVRQIRRWIRRKSYLIRITTLSLYTDSLRTPT
jgi:transposase-like protein